MRGLAATQATVRLDYEQCLFSWSTSVENARDTFSGCRPRFSRLAASPLACAYNPVTKSEEKERLFAVYGPSGQFRLLVRNYKCPKIMP